MRSYLSLIPISEKKHRKQSRMTRLCIILAVFLVTAIFSMADMEMRSQLRQAIRDNGYWHVSIRNITEQTADAIRARKDIACVCPYAAANYRLAEEYTIEGKRTVICAFDNNFRAIYENAGITGDIPTNDSEMLICESMANKLNKHIGDCVTMTMPDGTSKDYTVTGTISDTELMTASDCFGVVTTVDTLLSLTGETEDKVTYFVQIKGNGNVRRTIDSLTEELAGSGASIGENSKILGITGMSRDSYMLSLYATAGVLAILVITAGVLMIASNINSNLSKKTEFFGMMRCLGATRTQVRNFVLLEALNWCISAIPIGVISGSLVSCALCALLRALSPNYFSEMPVFAISGIAIVAGFVIGLITVLFAAIAPARKASKVSPLTAVSGNAYSTYHKHSKMHLWLLPIQVKLGIHHSYQSKKNFVLMVSSFALSIILFLAFSTGIDFLHHALKPLQVYTPDLSIYSKDNLCEIAPSFVDEIRSRDGVRNVYGRSFCYDMPIVLNGNQDLSMNLLSFEEIQFGWSEKKVMEGDLSLVQSGDAVMTVFDPANPIQVGDHITVTTDCGTFELPVGAILTDSPFTREDGVETVICSEETFANVTGKSAYTIIDVQLERGALDATVDEIHALFQENYVFSDMRASNESVRGAYLSMSVFIYGFVAIIGIISFFQIINSVAISVNARIHEYGTMRAIGAEHEQLRQMILAESVAYGLSGIVTGTILGIPMHRMLYEWLITQRWGDAWELPIGVVSIILVLILLSCVLAILRPCKEMRQMSVTETLATF